ncbi:MAG: hypothetical protein WCS70_04070 [Verrucomicrobiota bacterium]
MSTLTEIEAAADELTPEQQEALIKYLAERVQQRNGKGAVSNLAEFSGTLTLREDPLAWQTSIRNEWR